jgi:hypothetical protein
MLEIVFVALATAAVARLARRRGGRGWIWATALVLSYLVVGNLAALVVGRGPALVVGLVWIGAFFGIVFLAVGGGRAARDSWQCPECQFFNEPTTLVCPCGHRAKAGKGV